MNTFQTAALAAMTLTSAAALRSAWRSRRWADKRRLIAAVSAMRCDSVGNIGISIICSGVDCMAQIENLASHEYESFEVILCLDSDTSLRRMRNIIDRYALFKVALPSRSELPVVGVRAIYRSRRGAIRRMTLIDKRFTSHEDALDAAVNVASFDYVMAVGRNEYLYPDSIDMLAAQIGEHDACSVDMLECTTSGGRLFLRDAIVSLGGYAALRYMRPRRIKRVINRIPDRYRIAGRSAAIRRAIAAITAVVASLVLLVLSGFEPLAAALTATVLLTVVCRAYARKCRELTV